MNQNRLHEEQDNNGDRKLRLAIEALRRNPKDLEALRCCFEVYDRRRDSGNAGKVLDVVLGINDKLAWAHAEKAALSLGAGQLGQAETAVRRALALDPSLPRAHTIAANVFSELNRLAAGEWHFRRALELGGPGCENLTQLGQNLVQQGRVDEAEAVFSEALALDPKNIQTLGYFARLREMQGRFDEAQQTLDDADTVEPGSVSLLRARLLARQGRHSEALALLDQSPQLNGDALLERGRLNERLGRYDLAWTDFVEAKHRLAREDGAIRYDSNAVERFFDAMRDRFRRDRMAVLPRAAVREDLSQPLFIIGAPRSGTTLLERMLASHSQIGAGGELPFIGEFRELLMRLLPGAPFPENLSALSAADCHVTAALLRDYYLARRAELLHADPSCRYVVDKMPFNEMYLPLIRIAFPVCPVIHLERHPLDVAVSMLGNKLNHGFFCAYAMDDIAHHLTAVAELHQSYRMAFDTGETTLRYEDLVGDPEGALRTLFEYLALPFETQCLEFHRDQRYSPTPSYGDVNREIRKTAVARYRHYRNHLQPLSDRFERLLSVTAYDIDWGLE